MNKKKGILLGNVTNIIIAVLGLMIFGFFVVQVYKLYVGQESENAKNLLEVLAGKIEALEVGQNSSVLIQGFTQDKNQWVLIGWGKNEGEQEGKPDKCFGRSCLCACILNTQFLETAVNQIDSDGLCKNEAGCLLARKTVGEACQTNGFCKFFDTDLETRTIMNDKYNYYIMAPRTLEAFSINKNSAKTLVFINKSFSDEEVERPDYIPGAK